MYSQKLAEIKKTLDPKIAGAVLATNAEAKLGLVIQKYKIHVDDAGEVFALIMLMNYGAIKSSECFSAINNMHVIDDEHIDKFIIDINQMVLEPLQAKLRASVEESQKTAEPQKITEQSTEKVVPKTITIEPKETAPQKSFFQNLSSKTTEPELNEPIQPQGINLLNKIHSIGNENFEDSNKDEQEETAEEILTRIDKEVEAEIRAEAEAEVAEKIKNQKQQPTQTPTTQTPNENQSIFKPNMDEVDIDLDQIPKTTVPTYINHQAHLNESINESTNNSPQEDDQTNTNFALARASGEIGLKIDDSQVYTKDPYREEL